MPQLVVSNAGEVELLDLAIRRAAGSPRGWVCHCYKNDYTPNRDTVLANLTESTFAGYAPIELDDATWTEPVSNGFNASSFYGTSPLVFTPASTTLDVIYGYYVTFAGGMTLLYSQRLDNPFLPTPLLPFTIMLGFGSRSQSEPPP